MQKAKVSILLNGYVKFDSKTYHGFAQPTVTLIEDGKNKIVVDPGTIKNLSELKRNLKKKGYNFEDITHVVITHEHHDHYKNMALFKNSLNINFWGEWDGINLRFNQKDRKISPNVKLVMTPGHDPSGISLLINTSNGVYAISGDIFYDKNGPKKDEFASNKTKLKNSRNKLLKEADFIIPGHGEPFSVKEYNPK